LSGVVDPNVRGGHSDRLELFDKLMGAAYCGVRKLMSQMRQERNVSGYMPLVLETFAAALRISQSASEMRPATEHWMQEESRMPWANFVRNPIKTLNRDVGFDDRL
jgi:hypothetical protein